MRALGPFDLVFCRNVLIYFDIETKRKILNELHGTLFRGGYLLLGGSETTLNLVDCFERRIFGQTVLYQVPERRSMPVGFPLNAYRADLRHRRNRLPDDAGYRGPPVDASGPLTDTVTGAVYFAGEWRGALLIECTRQQACIRSPFHGRGSAG